MKKHVLPIPYSALILLTLIFSCSDEIEQPATTCPEVNSNVDREMSILVDASHDGGGWWFPQSHQTGFSAEQDHQGKPLADYLRDLGYTVTELGRGETITSPLLCQYNKVIRAGKYRTYTASELQAYEEFVNRGATLILISEYLRQYSRDKLAEQLGLNFIGSAKGMVEDFGQHAITENIQPFFYNAGSVILDAQNNDDIEVLGWLPKNTTVDYHNGRITDATTKSEGIAVMGILHHPQSKIFFIGDINCLEAMPQPLVSNLFQWAFE